MNITKSSLDLSKRSGPIPPSMIQLEDVIHYHQSTEDQNISFQLGPLTLDIVSAEILVVLGPSGSGKTTLLRLIAGLQWPQQGRIGINGKVVSSKKSRLLPEKRDVGMVFQEQALFPHLTVKENILFGLQKMAISERERRLIELEDLLELRNLTQRFPYELSGGQQQRVALARTLAPNPSVVLMDEPLSNIDVELRYQVGQELRAALKKVGITTIWVTHDQGEAFDLADRVMVFNEGKIEQLAIPRELYHHPKTRFVADFIGEAIFLPGTIKGDMILTELGSFKNPLSDTPNPQVEVMIRPECVQASPYDGGLGTVFNRQFRGSRTLYTIVLKSGQKILTYQSSTTIWPQGTKVKITIDFEHLKVFQKAEEVK